MYVTFVLPVVPPLAGGNRVVFEYGNQLVDMGHEVSIVFPAQSADRRYDEWFGLKSKLRVVKHGLMRMIQGKAIEWFDLRKEVRFVEVPNLLERHIPDADIIVATFWSTAPWVNGYSERKGRKFYLIQHYEAEIMGPKEMVDATWRMPLRKIVIARWLKDLAEREFGEKIYELITNGVNFDHFFNENKVFNIPRRIGMMYHPAYWKGISDGIKAFEIAREKHPEIRLVMFGVYRPDFFLPDYVEFHHKPYGESLRRLYCSLDIFLSPSWTEGCQLPPMEAMSCQCALVATDVGGVPDYTVPGETALVSPPRKPELLAENIIALLDDPERLQQISLAGYRKIREFTWQKAAKKLEAAFLRSLQE